MVSTVYKNYIDGEWVAAASGETFADTNPARPDDADRRVRQEPRGRYRCGGDRRASSVPGVASDPGTPAW